MKRLSNGLVSFAGKRIAMAQSTAGFLVHTNVTTQSHYLFSGIDAVSDPCASGFCAAFAEWTIIHLLETERN